ncbi:hypothetical protein SLS54_008149 [Diplodia seriata]
MSSLYTTTVPSTHESNNLEMSEDATKETAALFAPEEHSPLKSTSVLQKLTGWRGTLALNIGVVTAVLIINVGILVWASMTFDSSDGQAVMLEGDCQATKRIATVSHLAINVTGSLLLSASNYTMQVLLSPTRDEVERVHKRGQWVAIGIHSWRNFTCVDRKRCWLWTVLALSSVPFHLMYNSVVFSSVTATQYHVAVVTQDFTTGAPFSSSATNSAISVLQNNSELTTMGNEKCIATYGSQFQSEYRNVLLVADGNVQTNSSIIWANFSSPESLPSYSWICLNSIDPHCNPDRLRKNVTKGQDWVVGGTTIKNCLLEKAPPTNCRINFNFSLLITVIVANVAKLVAMGITLWKLNTPTLATIGDAVSSFLERRDESFKGRCLASGSDLKTLLRIDP